MWVCVHCKKKTSCQSKDQLLRRVPAWITHPCCPRSRLTARWRIWANHCPEGCVLRVCAFDACCREKRHVDCGPNILRLLTQASLPGGPFCRSLRCVVCTSETAYRCASMQPHFFFIFPVSVSGRSLRESSWDFSSSVFAGQFAFVVCSLDCRDETHAV